MKLLSGFSMWAVMICLAVPSSAQLLKKFQQKVDKSVDNAVDKQLGINQNQNTNQNQNPNQNTPGGTNAGGNNTSGGELGQNQGGGGLIATPPDVKQNLADAKDLEAMKLVLGQMKYLAQQWKFSIFPPFSPST